MTATAGPTCEVSVRLVRQQAGDAGAVHAQLQVVELLAQLLDVALLAVQLHLQLVAVRRLLHQLLWGSGGVSITIGEGRARSGDDVR